MSPHVVTSIKRPVTDMSSSQNSLSENKNTRVRLHEWNMGGGQRIAFLLGLSALTCAVIVFSLRIKTGLRLFEFGDETEKFVVAQMLNQGLHLYRDVFAHHGPVPYMLAHLYTKVISQTDFSFIRLEVAFLAAASCLSVAFSPILKSVTARVWAAALYLFLLSFVWVLQGIHMLLYHPIGGFLFVIALSQMVLPALFGEEINDNGLFFSGFSLTLTCFSAYTFGPAAVFFVFSTLLSLKVSPEIPGRYLKKFSLGMVSALTIVVLWLIAFGDLLGYLVYHYYFNQKVYAKFIDFSSLQILDNFNLSFSPQNIVQTTSVCFLIAWIYALIWIAFNKSGIVRTVLLKAGAVLFLLAAVLFVNPRGMSTFHNAGFVVLNLAAVSLITARILQSQLRNFSWWGLIHSLALMMLIVFITKQVSQNAISTPHGASERDFTRFVVDQKPEQSEIYDYVRSVADKKERILSLVFSPGVYIKAGRLPASGHFYYLPWQAEYNHASVLGYKIDICKDIEALRPPVIWLDNWKVWDTYALDQYEPCVPDLIKRHYTPLSGHGGFYIRKDIKRRQPFLSGHRLWTNP